MYYVMFIEFLSLSVMYFHYGLKISLVFRKVCIFDLVVAFAFIPPILPLIHPFLKLLLYGLSVLNDIL